jgi:hypothetical protein
MPRREGSEFFMQRGIALVIVVLGMLGLIGCSAQPIGEKSTEGIETDTVSAHGASSTAPEIVTGAVVETMDAAGYTYIRVDTDGGEIWAAANRFAVEEGDRVTFPLETPMKDFRSESLDREFPLIYFVSYVAPEGAAPERAEATTVDLPAGHPPLDAFAIDPAKASTAGAAVTGGGMRIVDLWNRRVDLEGRTVTISGRVVKYNAAILGTATGIVAIDRDFGAGYRYTVMLEDAIVTQH